MKVSGILALIMIGAASSAAISAGPAAAGGQDVGWDSTWSVAYQGRGGTFPAQTTARQIVHTSIGGTAARLRLSNVFNDQPLSLSDFHLARRASGASVVAATDRTVTFGGKTSVTIPVGGQAVSDPVSFVVTPESDVAVSFFVPTLAQNVDIHQSAFENQYLAAGDVSGAANLAVTQTFSSYFITSDVDVMNAAAAGSVVAFGASITDGFNTTFGTNRRYPNLLESRLLGSGRTVGVANEGIAGNNLLGPGSGPDALDRFDRDVLHRSGVRYVIFADDPINDLGSGREPTGAQLIAGLQQLISRAHAAGVTFICATLTPFEGYQTWTASREIAREEYDAIVRDANSGCDGVADFDAATHDPKQPARYLPEFDSGDHLHPNDAGMQSIANSIPLSLFGPAGIPPAVTTLTAAFNNVAVTDDSNTGLGNFDGGGASFSAQALATGGAAAGKTVTTGGVALTWPATAGTGRPDNAVATGQTITVPGSGRTLAFLFSADYGSVTGRGTINYTDGTSQAYTLTSPDWFVTSTADATVTVIAPYQNRVANARFNQPSAIFGASIALATGKTVASIRLPAAGTVPIQAGAPSMHIFTARIG
jgi:lysophospholipase L1-like esterase